MSYIFGDNNLEIFLNDTGVFEKLRRHFDISECIIHKRLKIQFVQWDPLNTIHFVSKRFSIDSMDNQLLQIGSLNNETEIKISDFNEESNMIENRRNVYRIINDSNFELEIDTP